MVLLIIIPMKWLFVWEYSLFSDKPTCVCNLMSFVLLYAMCVLCLLAVHNTEMYCIYSIVYVLFHTDVERLRCLYVSSACFYRTVYAASPSLVDCGCCPSQVVSRALPGIPTNSGLFKQWASSGCQSLVTIMVSSIYICIYIISMPNK